MSEDVGQLDEKVAPGCKGDNPRNHGIVGGRFVCIAGPDAKCRVYPDCECEEWSSDLHGDPPAPGHEDKPQQQCWIKDWMEATSLSDNFGPDDLLPEDHPWPDGGVCIVWHGDYITWEYDDESLNDQRKPVTFDTHAEALDYLTEQRLDGVYPPGSEASS